MKSTKSIFNQKVKIKALFKISFMQIPNLDKPEFQISNL